MYSNSIANNSIIYTQLKDCWQRSPYVGKDFSELTALMNQKRKKKKKLKEIQSLVQE